MYIMFLQNLFALAEVQGQWVTIAEAQQLTHINQGYAVTMVSGDRLLGCTPRDSVYLAAA